MTPKVPVVPTLLPLLALLFLPSQVFAEAPRGVDLSSGIVLPSNNSAVYENGAAIAGGNVKGLDILTGWYAGGTPDAFTATYVRSGGGKGFGLGASHVSNVTTALLGGGWELGPVELGLSGSYVLSSSSFALDAGLRTELGGDFRMAVVLHDVLNFGYHWTLGFGGIVSRFIAVEEDFDIRHGGGITTLSSIDGTLSLSAVNPKGISLRIGLPHALYPTPSFQLNGFELGLSFWLGDALGVYGLYDTPNRTYQVGIKIQ